MTSSLLLESHSISQHTLRSPGKQTAAFVNLSILGKCLLQTLSILVSAPPLKLLKNLVSSATQQHGERIMEETHRERNELFSDTHFYILTSLLNVHLPYWSRKVRCQCWNNSHYLFLNEIKIISGIFKSCAIFPVLQAAWALLVVDLWDN